MFSNCNMLPDSKETKPRSRNKEASPSASKNSRVVLVPCCIWKCVPTATSCDEDIVEVLGVIVTTDKFSVRVKRITSRIKFS